MCVCVRVCALFSYVLLGSWLDYSLKYEVSGKSSSSIMAGALVSARAGILGEDSQEGKEATRCALPYLLTRIPGFRIDVDYYSTFEKVERPHLGIRLFQIVEVLHDLIVVHTQIKVIERHRFLLLLAGGWGARGAGGGWRGRGGRWRRRRWCGGGRGRAAGRCSGVHGGYGGGHHGGGGERRVHWITDYGRSLDLPGSPGVFRVSVAVVVIHQLHEFLVLASLLACVVHPRLPVRFDYVMIRLLRCFAAVPMIIPVTAAATTAGRPMAMLPRRFRQVPHAHSRVPVWRYWRFIIFVIAVARAVRADRSRGRGRRCRCRVRDRHSVRRQRRRNVIVAVKTKIRDKIHAFAKLQRNIKRIRNRKQLKEYYRKLKSKIFESLQGISFRYRFLPC